ncbi:uncharacterized protein LOC143285925 [Babylonia areolata]|uniref:uncharacterized protein LOC143285925 n=1 Tax=Babylonia areolata TaxID=304850 RepID=UPI003FD4653C
MAKLCRLVKLHDRFNAQVFTFMVPSKILREFSPDVYSKDFVYGQQKWNVSFVRSDRHLGAFLKLTTPSQGLRCRLDFSFTIVNSEHFTKVTDPDSIYVDPEDRKMSVYVEWQESHLLILPNYNSQDDVTRLHKHQMTREIMALQAENYALEKQLYSYQQSIAKKDSRGRADSFDYVQK